MPQKVSSYVVLTPARNEGQEIEQTIRCMCRQTIPPAEWVIIDDGSTDRTGDTIDSYAKQYSWITAVHLADRGFRLPGTGVIDAVMEGYRSLRTNTWEYIVKFDADLDPEPMYFERCLEQFQRDPNLGISGGVVYQLSHGKPQIDSNPAFHVRGATKIYRRACWEALGGLVSAPGWDTLDEVKANMLGWSTRTLPGIPIRQRRPTGSNDGVWRDYVKNGRANYICGYHPLFMVLKCLKRALQRPYVRASLALITGYAGGYLKRMPRINDPALIRYVRNQQLRRLTLRTSIWK